MSSHNIGTSEEGLRAGVEPLDAGAQPTRRKDDLAERRRDLSWVRIDTPYRFETDEGIASLADLFRGRSQLLIFHCMFGPDDTDRCSASAEGINRSIAHLADRDVTLVAVSRAPLAKLQAYKQRMRWTFPWASSLDNDFSHNLRAVFAENEKREAMSAFLFEGGVVYHTNSAYLRGTDDPEAAVWALAAERALTFAKIMGDVAQTIPLGGSR